MRSLEPAALPPAPEVCPAPLRGFLPPPFLLLGTHMTGGMGQVKLMIPLLDSPLLHRAKPALSVLASPAQTELA